MPSRRCARTATSSWSRPATRFRDRPERGRQGRSPSAPTRSPTARRSTPPTPAYANRLHLASPASPPSAATGDNGYVSSARNDDYPASLSGRDRRRRHEHRWPAAKRPRVRRVGLVWRRLRLRSSRRPKPSYQTDTGCAGRSYADVSADADPNTGLGVYDTGNGGWLLVGGTSLATPLIAAYEAVTGVDADRSPQWAYTEQRAAQRPHLRLDRRLPRRTSPTSATPARLRRPHRRWAPSPALS